MIQFTRKDFEEAEATLNELYEEVFEREKRLNAIKKELAIAEEERNFIADWLKRNGVAEDDEIV